MASTFDSEKSARKAIDDELAALDAQKVIEESEALLKAHDEKAAKSGSGQIPPPAPPQ